jgi:hypothetical protein
MATDYPGGTEGTAREDAAPWDRQPGEPNLWFDRFERFRLAGPSRSLLAILNAERERHGKRKGRSVPTAWTKNARLWDWRARALAWDEHERRQTRARHAEQKAEMDHRHIQEAKAIQSKVIQRLKSLDPSELSPTDLARLFVPAVNVERIASGELAPLVEPSTTRAGTPRFSMEEIVAAQKEVEDWENDRLRSDGTRTFPPGDSKDR